MSWRFPDANISTPQVVNEESLNDGFMPAATEAQGKLNEHNIASGIVPGAAFGASQFIPDTYVDPVGVGFEYVNTRGPAASQVTADGGGSPGGTRGAWITIDEVGTHNTVSTRPNLDGGVRIDLNPTMSVIGAKTPPKQQPGMTDPRPMQAKFFVEVDTTLWVMATLQVQEEQRAGQMFALRINGAVVSEGMFGGADISNDRIGTKGSSVDTPMAEVGIFSPSAGAAGNEIGYPVCIEAVIDVPPGDVTVEVLGMNTASLKGGSVSASDGIVCVGGRELVILKMMR